MILIAIIGFGRSEKLPSLWPTDPGALNSEGSRGCLGLMFEEFRAQGLGFAVEFGLSV